MKTFELRITEEVRSSLKQEKADVFDTIKETFQTLEELKNFLYSRYGKMPRGRNKIFRDTLNKDGNKTSVNVGFLHSYWNQDCSHNSAKWFQTDWIEIYEQETTRTYNIKL